MARLNIPALLSCVALTACAAKAPPPTLSLDGRSCGPQIDLKNGQIPPLELNKAATVTLDGNTTCWQAPDGSRNVYTVFRLPQLRVPPLVDVTSAPLGEGLFSPHVLMLDSDGNILRDVPRDSFSFHGPALHIGIRAHADETYVLVASDPKTVGSGISQIFDGTTLTSTTTISKGGATFTSASNWGHENTLGLTYSYNGIVSVLLQSVPTGS
jgi:hypothetical protein